MSDDKHKRELIETITDQIEITDKLPFHPKNKLKLYQEWTLSKVSWHLTVTKISNIWRKNNIDNIASRFRLQAVAGDTSKWHFEHGHPVQTRIRTRSDITIYKTHPMSSDIPKQLNSNHNICEIHKSSRNIDINTISSIQY